MIKKKKKKKKKRWGWLRGHFTVWRVSILLAGKICFDLFKLERREYLHGMLEKIVALILTWVSQGFAAMSSAKLVFSLT